MSDEDFQWAMRYAERASRRAFWDGFLAGMMAGALLLSGFLMVLSLLLRT